MLDSQDKNLISNIVDELEDHQKSFFDFIRKNKLKISPFFKIWSENIIKDIRRDPNNILNFRKLNLTVADTPSYNSAYKKMLFKLCSSIFFFKKIHPQISILEDAYYFAKNKNLLHTMKRFSLPLTGNVSYYKKNDLLFTHKWIRHHWLLSLFEKNLAKKKSISIILDIGSNYGLFEYLLKKNYPDKKFIMTDFPEKLAVANFFLKKEFPEAKFLTYKNIKDMEYLDRDIVNNYDFILIPTFYVNKFKKNSADVLCNFASFNEMENWWFRYYLESDIVNSASYLFTLNRIIKPKYDPESKDDPISILDFNLDNYEKIHFDICALYKLSYETEKIFGIPIFSDKKYHEPVFEYIGRKKN